MDSTKFDFSKPILENFKKIEEYEKMVAEQSGDPEAKFNASSFFIGANHRPLALKVDYRGKVRIKGGGFQFTKSYKEMLVYATFCPFTGKPLYEEKQGE